MNNPLDDRHSVETPQLWDRPPLHVVPAPTPASGAAGEDLGDVTDQSPPGDRPALVLLLSIPQAGKALGIGRSKIYELIADGELETVHIGRAVRLPVDTVAAFVRNLRQPPRHPGA